jgi:hypothetical protein
MSLLRPWFEWVHEFPSAIAIRESLNAFNVLTTIHVIAMCLFAGLVVMMDLRLLGLANTRTPFSEVQRRLFPGQMLGMAVSVVTGAALFYAQPMRFYSNVFFWIKMLMIAIAGANAMAFHWTTYRFVAVWDTAPGPPPLAKLAGFLSIVLWVSVVICGRLIAYNWFSY